jgi:hypothetical protein
MGQNERMRNRSLLTAAIVAASAMLCASLSGATAQPPTTRQITWADVEAVRPRLSAAGLTAASFRTSIDRIHQDDLRRMREGDLDHLVFYALQSTRFTTLPPIEPALSARALVESLVPARRESFLRDAAAPPPEIPAAVRGRIEAFVRALESSTQDPRLIYFQHLVSTTFPARGQREASLLREYVRAMRFLYQKEFVAQPSGTNAVAELYRARGLSTDTAVEAGYVVYNGLGIVRSLAPDRQVRRVLIVGPGLDLAPRTGLLEAGPPESYQPWAVIDALLSLGLSRVDDLQIVAADINPRVVEHIQQSHIRPPVLTLVSGIGEGNGVSLSSDYREYFALLGNAIGTVATSDAQSPARSAGHLFKTVHVGDKAARALSAVLLDIVTERLDAPGFDLIVATNILPYFDDVELTLAMSNVTSMLAPGGVFLHNEPRPILGDITDALGAPYEQSRQVVIASVRETAGKGSARPGSLVDSVWLHRKRQSR